MGLYYILILSSKQSKTIQYISNQDHIKPNQKKPRIEQMPSEYIYCYQKNNSESLVILKKQQQILSQMIKIQQTLFIWINHQSQDKVINGQENNGEDQVFKCDVKYLSEQFDLRVIGVAGYDACLNAIKEAGQNQKIVVILSQKIAEMGQELVLTPKVKGIICYPQQKQQSTEYRNGKFFISVQDYNTLISTLLKNRQKQFIYKELPNFLSIKDKIQSSRIHTKTMFAMLNQKKNKYVRTMIVDQLGRLMKMMEETCVEFKHYEEMTKKFIAEIRGNCLDIKRVIYWYTCESTVYKFTNSLLRSAMHPAQAFYIQPFFRDLFQAVSEMYAIQKQKQDLKQFVCYRGAVISAKQIEYFKNNIGGIVQNLGFLSTSIQKQSGFVFFSNVLFEIKVKNQQRAKECDFGYAMISSHSQFCVQSQILFNCLNSFRVIEVQQKVDNNTLTYNVKLQYGELARLAIKKELGQYDQLYRDLGRLQIRMRNRIISQGHALMGQGQNLDGAEQYWQKYLQNASTMKQKIIGHREYSIHYQYKHQFDKALDYNQQCIQLTRQEYGELSQQYALILSNKGDIKMLQNHNNEASYLYKKAIQIYQKLQKTQSDNYISTINSLAILEYKNTNFDKSLQIFQKYEKINLNLYGKFSIPHESFLYNGANCYTKLQEYEKAMTMYRECLEIVGLVLGDTHCYYGICLHSMGKVKYAEGDYREAYGLYKRALKILWRSMGAGHPYCLKILEDIAAIYYNLRKKSKVQAIHDIILKLTSQDQFMITFQGIDEDLKKFMGNNMPKLKITMPNKIKFLKKDKKLTNKSIDFINFRM